MAIDDSTLRLPRAKRAILYSLVFLAIVVFAVGRFTADEQGVRELAFERLRASFPKAALTELDGTIGIVHEDGRRQAFDLAAAQSQCAAKPRRCADTIDDALIVLIDRLEGRRPMVDPPPPEPKNPVPK